MKAAQRRTFCLIAALCALLVPCAGIAGAQDENGLSWINKLLSPGPLSRAHSEQDNGAGCVKCHQGRKGLRNSLCKECHKPIVERMKARTGYHGKLEGDCFDCHTEHKGREHDIVGLDPDRFNHDTAVFHVTGKHHELACAECHGIKNGEHKLQTLYYIGLPQRCAECHEDPHEGQFDRACEECHSDHGWKGADLRFDHRTMSTFQIEGRHATVACVECHEGLKRFRPLDAACAACHEDPHAGQFSPDKQCAACHVDAGWKGGFLVFDHQVDARYPLTGRHVGLECAGCHEEGRYRNGLTKCADCHDDPHGGRLEAECEACHVDRGFRGPDLIFDHNRQTDFQITPLHADTSCSACHPDLTYAVGGATCETCHDDAEGFFAGALFPDLVPATPDVMHGRVQCIDCHKADDPKASSTLVTPRCVSCHTSSYARYLNEWRGLLSDRIERMAALPEHGEATRSQECLDAVRRFAPHNFLYARRLLDALEGR